MPRPPIDAYPLTSSAMMVEAEAAEEAKEAVVVEEAVACLTSIGLIWSPVVWDIQPLRPKGREVQPRRYGPLCCVGR